MREYRYLTEAGITLGADVKDGYARVAMAAQSPEDRFNPRTGKDIINILFDCGDDTLKALGLSRNVVRFPYDGGKPQKHILRPLIDYLADQLGERIFTRKLRRLFAESALTAADAREVSQDLNDTSFIVDFTYVKRVIDDEQTLNLLSTIETEEDLSALFFSWEGTVASLMKNLRRFASEVYSETLTLGDATEPKKVAPRRETPQTESSTPRSVVASPVKPKKEV